MEDGENGALQQTLRVTLMVWWHGRVQSAPTWRYLSPASESLTYSRTTVSFCPHYYALNPSHTMSILNPLQTVLCSARLEIQPGQPSQGNDALAGPDKTVLCLNLATGTLLSSMVFPG